MKKTHQRAMRRGVPAAAAVGVLATGLGVGFIASAEEHECTAQDSATITMKLGSKGPSFAGAKEVTAGERLRIRNATNPRKIGPHTFTLATEGVLPKTKKAIKRCQKRPRLCFRVGVAHRFNPRTNKVGRHLVRKGEKGWDTPFTKRAQGDSWYTEEQGEDFSQVVSAKAGTTLHYICVTHPEMQGAIDVVEGEETPLR